MMRSGELISIVEVRDPSKIYEKVKKGFDLIGVPEFKSSDVVAIKPNLCCIKGPETGATTDPRVVEGIIRYLQEEFKISDISIVEADGTQLLADMAFKLLGYESLSKKLNVKLVNLSKAPCSDKVFEKNVFLKKISCPDILEKANWLISVPKIKRHTLTVLGGTMKNQFGCNPFPKKSRYHKRLDDCVVDLNVAFKPQLIVVDGLIGMEGDGPVGGVPVKMNSLIFGRDVVAMDHLISKIIGVNPKKVKHLVKAQSRGLGTTNYEVVGQDISEIQCFFKKKPGMGNLYNLLSV